MQKLSQENVGDKREQRNSSLPITSSQALPHLAGLEAGTATPFLQKRLWSPVVQVPGSDHGGQQKGYPSWLPETLQDIWESPRGEELLITEQEKEKMAGGSTHELPTDPPLDSSGDNLHYKTPWNTSYS